MTNETVNSSATRLIPPTTYGFPEALPFHFSVQKRDTLVTVSDAGKLSPQARALKPHATPSETPRPPPFTRLSSLRCTYERELSRFAGWLARHYILASVQVEGVKNLSPCSEATHFERGRVFFPTHTDIILDPIVFLGLVRHLPQRAVADGALRGARVSAITRHPKDLLEHFALSFLGRPMVHALTLVGSKHDPTEVENARRSNRTTLRRVVQDSLETGEHAVIFPQGSIYGIGDIEVKQTGGLRALSRHVDGAPVCMHAVGVTYEFLVAGKPRVIVAVGPKTSFETPDLASNLASEVRVALLRLGALTISGIVGALMLSEHGQPNLQSLSRQTLQKMIGEVIDAAQLVSHLTIDASLLQSQRSTEVEAAYDQMVVRNYLTAEGNVTNRRAGHELVGLHTNKAHREDPLGFAGRRLSEQAKADEILADILKKAFATATGSPPPPVAASSPAGSEGSMTRHIESCTVM